MEANTRHLERIFDQTIQYQVPLFQRPYVWTREANLEPLWEDVHALLDKLIRGGKGHPNFLGAVVLELLFELSPTTMIRPTTSPITTATSPLGPHPCRRRSDIVHPVSLDGVPLFVQSGCLTTPTARRL